MSANHRLSGLVAKAKAMNMPGAKIEGAIEKATKSAGADAMERCEYEGTGPGGCFVVVECLTDKRTRTAAEMRHIFRGAGGALGQPGSAAFNFETVGVVDLTAKKSLLEDAILDAALSAGADDVEWDEEEEEDGTHAARIVCAPAAFPKVLEAFTALAKPKAPSAGPLPTIHNAAIIRRPTNTVELDPEQEDAFRTMLGEFEDSQDVQNVYHNVQ
jgi:YebC/PmpR family DNA-binding regulatory protein